MKDNESRTISNQIGKATVWSLAAEISAKIIVPVTNIVLARILTPDAFGIIATINMVISFADTLSIAGFQKYIIQHEYKDKKELFSSANVAFWTNFIMSMLLWIIICLWRNPISEMVGNPGYGKALAVAALSLPLTGLSSIQEAMFQRELNYQMLFYRRIGVSLLPFVVTIPLALAGFGYWALIFGNIAGNVLKIVLLTIASKWRPHFFYSFKLLREMFSFSIWTLLESIALWATTYIDILVISNHMGAYYTGLYKNSQSTVSSILSIITGATTSVLFASLSRLQDDKVNFEKTFYSFQKNVAVFVLPLGMGIFMYSDLVTNILLGNQWIEASEFIGIWGLCTSLVCVFGTFSREVYRAKAKPVISLITQVIHLAFVIPLCLIAVEYGFQRLSYVRSFAYLQIILVHFIFIKLVFQMSPLKMIWNVKEPLICTVLMGGVAYLLQRSGVGMVAQFIQVLICIIFYFSLLCIFGEYRKILYEVLSKITKKRKIS